jgi:hypothetical protein
MTLTELKNQIFSSGNINADWDSDRPGTIAQVESEGHFILATKVEENEISQEEMNDLISKLLDEYQSPA